MTPEATGIIMMIVSILIVLTVLFGGLIIENNKEKKLSRIQYGKLNFLHKELEVQYGKMLDRHVELVFYDKENNEIIFEHTTIRHLGISAFSGNYIYLGEL